MSKTRSVQRLSLWPTHVLRGLLVLALAIGSAVVPSNADGQEFPGLGPRGELTALEFEGVSQFPLVGRNARRQLLVTGVYSSGQRHDLTHDVQYQVANPNILDVSPQGIVNPKADGATEVVASFSGREVRVGLNVEQCGSELPVNFVDEVVPIFTKLGCNQGACHGKADGQNGFKLSLLGFYPEDDYEYLVHEDRGRRVFPADPDFSLLLQKPANLVPHGGGKLLEENSYEWQLIARWIRQGMPFGSPEDPVLTRIEVLPKVREMSLQGSQQLSVLGHYSDGSVRDVTQLTAFEPNIVEMASASDSGRISVSGVPGEVAVMVRFQGQVDVFRAVIPQGLAVTNLPVARTFIDQHVFNKWVALGIPPSDLCDDSTFIRRVTIDIAGRLPTLDETTAFLADTSPDKRDRLVDRLVDSDGYADYFANKWSNVLRNKRRNATDQRYTYAFHDWIRQAMTSNMPYDQFVREILTASGDAQTHPPVAWYREVATASQRMEDTAQLFLGMRLACAKCHHHPFERWSQQDYYGFEAFFSQVDTKTTRFNPQQNIPDAVFVKVQVPQSINPRTNLPVPPTGLGSQPLELPEYADARHAMVDWMVDPENPFFARALVNRYWKHFMGRGIVDPEDDLRVTNPPSNPELLDALAKHFIDHRFDLKDLVRMICKSNAYQLASNPTPLNHLDRQNFSSFQPRRLNAEVLYDSINQLTAFESNFGGVPVGTTAVSLPDNGFANYFLEVFGRPEAESACECERSPEANLSQSLHLLNSNDVQSRLQNGNGLAVAYARDETRDDASKIEEIFLRAYSRRPSAEETAFILQRMESYTNRQQAFEDVLWAVINTKEFQFIR